MFPIHPLNQIDSPTVLGSFLGFPDCQAQLVVVVDVVAGQQAAILELIAREEKALVLDADVHLVADDRLRAEDGGVSVKAQGDGLLVRLHEDLHGGRLGDVSIDIGCSLLFVVPLVNECLLLLIVVAAAAAVGLVVIARVVLGVRLVAAVA